MKKLTTLSKTNANLVAKNLQMELEFFLKQGKTLVR